VLPDLRGRYEDSSRSKSDTTFNEPKTATSTSSDRDLRTGDLSASWNLLDSAIGYVRAHQQADMALIVEERRRGVIHGLVNDTRRAYWRAVAATRAQQRMEPVLEDVRRALEQAQVRVDERIGAPLEALDYQRDLLVTLRELETRNRQLAEARTELAVLLNVHPSTELALAAASDAPGPPLAVETPLRTEDLELAALQNRSELRAEAYQLRANQREARVAILEMIPGLNFSPGVNYTSDSYKLHERWYDASVSVSWGLLGLVRGPRRRELVRSQIDLSKVRRLALSMAVISQVNVAMLRFEHARDDYGFASRLATINAAIAERLTAGAQAQTVGEARRVEGNVRSLLSSLQRDMAYAEMQAAFGVLVASIGVDPGAGALGETSLEALTRALAQVQSQWQPGDHGALPLR
jgi:multidrug efflux system outer membrane protein